MWAESGGVVLKEEEREVMEKGRIGALLSSVDAGHKDVLLKKINYNNYYLIVHIQCIHTCTLVLS